MHYSTSLAVTALLWQSISAFPTMPSLEDRQATINIMTQPNSGFYPNTEFNAEDQYVDVGPGSGHEFIAPGPTDIRGPCPGLNAAANHGFISRSGILNFDDTTLGLAKAFNFGIDFSSALFFFSVLNSGSILDQSWSIGGPMPTHTLGGLLGDGEGISNSHIKYEGDASPGRGDAFLHNGDAHSLNIGNYQAMYNFHDAAGEFSFYDLRLHSVGSHNYSLYNNPYFFTGPIFFVPPIAHQFIINMMSNHSADNIQGYLNTDMLNTFFSVVEGTDGTLTWVPGQEKIPNNWYKRPTSNMYGVTASFGDFGLLIDNFPQFASVGGNIGKTNSFTGVDLANLTGGAFNADTLLQGNNLACLAFEGSLAILPDALSNILAGIGPFFSLANQFFEPLFISLECPELTSFNSGLFAEYPGYNMKLPLQPDQPF